MKNETSADQSSDCMRQSPNERNGAGDEREEEEGVGKMEKGKKEGRR